VIPTYNRQESTLRAIESALDQQVANIEVVVVDDGSRPEFVLPAALSNSSRVRLVRHDANRGAAAARNTGLATARGRWVAFLDSDDRWLPGTLALRLAEAEASSAQEGLIVWVAAYMIVDPIRGSHEIRYPMVSSNPIDFASGCWVAAGSTSLFSRKAILQRIGGQDETLRRCEDNDWFLRLTLAGGEVRVSKIVAAEITPGPRPKLKTIDRSAAVIIDKISRGDIDPKLRAMLLRHLRAWRAVERASAHWYDGNYLRTATEFLKSWLLLPRPRFQLKKFWESAAPDLA
jgi:glycosyltransferase involved in cell wall biosynthesis